MNRAIFLDRDNTIIEDMGYLSNPDGICILPSVLSTLNILQHHRFLLIMVSNQSGIGRGYLTEHEYEVVQACLMTIMKENGITFTGFYHCPHHPDDHCECRKPKPFLAFKAAKEHNIDLTESFMVGDKDSDIEFGRNFGAKASFKSIHELFELKQQCKKGERDTVPSQKGNSECYFYF